VSFAGSLLFQFFHLLHDLVHLVLESNEEIVLMFLNHIVNLCPEVIEIVIDFGLKEVDFCSLFMELLIQLLWHLFSLVHTS